MSNRFHNKFHRHNHHSLSSTDVRFPDSGYDPIASFLSPFKGEFFSQGDIITTENLSAGKYITANNGKFLGSVFVGNLSSSSSTDIIVSEFGTLRTNSELFTFSQDLTANLRPGYTFGRYEGTDVIPASGKTIQEVIKMALDFPPLATIPISVVATVVPGSISITYNASMLVATDVLLFVNFVQYLTTTTSTLTAFVSIPIFPNFNFGTTTVTFPNDYNTLILGSATNTTPTVSIFGGRSAYKFDVNVSVTSIFSTPLPTLTPTPTQTPTPTNTGTATPTPSLANPTATPTDTKPTSTPTNTGTETATPTQTPTNTGTGTPTPTPTNTGTETPTPTPTNTGTETPTPTNTGTETPTPTNTGTETPTPTNTGTETPTPTNTGTSTPTPTPTEIQADMTGILSQIVEVSGFTSDFDGLAGDIFSSTGEGCLPFNQLPSLVNKTIAGSKGEDFCRKIAIEPVTLTLANSAFLTNVEGMNFGSFKGKAYKDDTRYMWELSGFACTLQGLNAVGGTYNSFTQVERTTIDVELSGYSCLLSNLNDFSIERSINADTTNAIISLSGWSGNLESITLYSTSDVYGVPLSDQMSLNVDVSGYAIREDLLNQYILSIPNAASDTSLFSYETTGYNCTFNQLTSYIGIGKNEQEFALITENILLVAEITGFAVKLLDLANYDIYDVLHESNPPDHTTIIGELSGFNCSANSLINYDHSYPIVINTIGSIVATSIYEMSAVKFDVTVSVPLTSHYIQWQTYDSTIGQWVNFGTPTNDSVVLLTADNVFQSPAVRFIQYLNTKYSTISLAVTSTPLNRTVAPTLPFSVPASNIEMWFASNIGTYNTNSAVSLNGQTVTKWCDLSRNENHALDTSSGNPTVLVGGLNALNTLRFVGGQELAGNISNLSNYSIFIVAKRNGSSPDPYTILFTAGVSGSSNTNNRLMQLGWNSSPDNFVFHPILSAFPTATSAIKQQRNDVYCIHAAVGRLGTGNSEYSCYSAATPTGNTQSISTISNQTIGGVLKYSIGSSTWGSTNYDLIGEIAEIIVLKYAVSNSERDSLITYLNNKWTVF